MRLPLFQKYLGERGIDLAFFLTPDITITYFTQLKPSFAFLMVTPSSADLFISKLDPFPRLKEVSITIAEKRWELQLAKFKAKKIALNYEAFSLASLGKLKKIFPQATFIDVSSKLKELRAQKTFFEIEKITSACRIADQIFAEVLKGLEKKEFHTENEVALFLEQRMREKKAEPSFPPIVAGGKNAAIPHHVTSTQKLQKGFLLLDFGAGYQNYCADMTRMVYLGKTRKSEKETYQFLLETRQETMAQIKERKLFFELEKHMHQKLGKFSSNFIHSLGHGLGLEVHESPSFAKEEQQRVQNNYVFTIEPGIYFPGKFGLRIEDTILFDKKTRILTTSPPELVEIPFLQMHHKPF